MLAVHCGSGVHFVGEAAVARYASSEWAERAFCKICGTHLYYKLLATGEYFMPAGAFDQEDFELASQIYIDKKPAYYALANRTPTLTEQQLIEKYANSTGTRD